MIEFVPQLPETRVTPFIRIRRERKLPIPGEVLVKPGTRVGALDVVARAYPPKQRRALSLTRILGVREADVPKRLLKQVGDPVEAREIIIAKPINLGLQRLVYRAPEAGQIAAIQGSWMVLDVYGPPYDLLALYRGTVIALMPRGGVVIDAQGALLQGAWGSGKEAVGLVRLVARTPDEMLHADALGADARGAILVAGGGVSEAALRRAEEVRASGIVTGSLAPELRLLAGQIGVPVLVTEGFGQRPMSAPAFELLQTLNRQEAALNARFALRGRGAQRPELFVPAPLSRISQDEDGKSEAPRTDSLRVSRGARVRGICEPYLGRVGTIAEEPSLKWIKTPSGVPLPGALIEWLDVGEESGKAFVEMVPWANLELIG